MTSRQWREGRQEQGEQEEVIYSITVPTSWGTSLSGPSAKVFDITGGKRNDVTATVMPTGSASVASQVITLPVLKLLTSGHLYRVEVKFTADGNVLECYGEVLAAR